MRKEFENEYRHKDIYAEQVLFAKLVGVEKLPIYFKAAVDAEAGFRLRVPGEQYVTSDGFTHNIPPEQFRIEVRATPDKIDKYKASLKEAMHK